MGDFFILKVRVLIQRRKKVILIGFEFDQELLISVITTDSLVFTDRLMDGRILNRV